MKVRQKTMEAEGLSNLFMYMPLEVREEALSFTNSSLGHKSGYQLPYSLQLQAQQVVGQGLLRGSKSSGIPGLQGIVHFQDLVILTFSDECILIDLGAEA